MAPAAYLQSIILPTYAEFQASPEDRRRAMLAAMVCYHMVDCIARAEGEKDEAKVYARHLARCPSLRTAKAVALAAKHIEVAQPDLRGVRLADVTVGRGAAFSDGSYYSDGSSHSDAPSRAVLEASGQVRKSDLTHVLRDVVEYWRSLYP